MARKRAASFVLAVSVLLAAAPLAWAPCEDDPFFVCGIQCGWWPGGVYCTDPSNPTRACWESGTGGACGEDADYEGCQGCWGLVADGGF